MFQYVTDSFGNYVFVRNQSKPVKVKDTAHATTGKYFRRTERHNFQFCSRGFLMTRRERRRRKGDILGLASFGFFLFLIGVLWVVTPNLFQEVVDFFKDFKLEEEIFPNIFLPAPEDSHPVVYTALARFCFVFGIFQIAILVLRFLFRDSVDRMAGTLSGMVFWLGVGFASNMLAAGDVGWFVFLGWFIVVVGLSLVVRSLLVLILRVALRKE